MPTDELSEVATARPLRREEYELLGRAGFFDDERVELLDGRIVTAAEEGPPHAAVHRRLARLLVEAVPATEGEVGVGNPLICSDLAVPQPDFMVVPQRDTYRWHHPTSASLVIEVAESSRRLDLGFKAVVYAAAGVPEYWVVDLVRDELVVHREPAGQTFGSIARHREGLVTALHHPRLAVDIRALLR